MTSVYYQHSPSATGWLAAVSGNSLLLVKLPTASGAPSGAATGAGALGVDAPGVDSLGVDALWRSISSANGVQATLDELTRGGLSATPSFALAEWEAGADSAPGTVRAIIRGDVTLVLQTAEGTTTRDANGVSTWLEQEWPGVRAFELRVGGSGETPDALSPQLPLLAGVAWAGRVGVAQSAAGQEPARTQETPAAPPQETPIVPTQKTPAAPPPIETPPVWVDPEATVTELNVLPTAMPSAPQQMSAVDSAGEGSYDYLFGETVFRTVEDAAVRDEGEQHATTTAAPGPSGPDGGSAATGDHDGHTVASVDIAKLRAGRKARKASAAPAPAAEPRLFLTLADGSREPLIQPILVGRSPSVSKVSGGQMPKLLTVAGPDQDISRNHAQFAVEGGTVVVTDLHSRNGTMVILPGRSPQQLRQGEPTSVIVGTVVDLGGGVTFTIGEE